MRSQIVCNGCRSLLIYARGATSVCCAVCNTITPVPPQGVDMAQIMCGGCRTLLMYNQGASSVRCSCCHTINIVRPANTMAPAQINCGNCRITLMYPYGAPSVKCAVCHYITNIGLQSLGPMRPPVPMASGLNEPRLMTPSTFARASQPQNVTVVVENPMTVDEKGKLVSNVVVGVTTGKK